VRIEGEIRQPYDLRLDRDRDVALDFSSADKPGLWVITSTIGGGGIGIGLDVGVRGRRLLTPPEEDQHEQ